MWANLDLEAVLRLMGPPDDVNETLRRAQLDGLLKGSAPDPRALNDLGCEWLTVSGGERMARAVFLTAARKGSIQALLNLGYIHWYGKGVPVNERKALAWYTAAAGRGSLDASYEIGQIYQGTDDSTPAHLSVTRNLHAARRFFAAAAGEGHAEAMFALGDLFLDADFEGRDEARGFYWLMGAASKGHPLAADRLADFFDSARMEPDDPGDLMKNFWRSYRASRDAACNVATNHQES